MAFHHGVASGDPTAFGVVLWTRVSVAARACVPVEWRVATDPCLAHVVARGRAEARAEADHTVSVAVGGLQPATTYWYGFEAGRLRSPVGRTRTAPHGPVDRLRLGIVCCAHWTTGFFNAYGRLADRDVDLVVHLGDYVYEDENPKAAGVRRHNPPGRVVTLADYRARHAQYRSDPDLQRLHARHPVAAVWDDHELAGNAWCDGAARHDPRTDGDWDTRRDAAIRAYREWMPLRPPDPSDARRMWRPVRLGGLCDLLLLDTRLAGRDRPAGLRRPVVGVRRRDRSLLGEEQWRWLAGELAPSAAAERPPGDSAPRWRLVASQVVAAPVHMVRVPRPLTRAGRLLGAVNGGLAVNAGQWDGYPDEQQRLFRLLGARPGDAVVLSGDLHSSWASSLAAEGCAPAAAEFVAPAVSAPSFARALAPKFPGGRALLERVIRAANPHVRWVKTSGHGYLLLDVTAARVEAQWWHVDTLRRPHRGEHLAAVWSVAHGDPRLVSRT